MRKPYITIPHLVMEIISYVLLVVTVAGVFIFIWKNGGKPVPTHYNFAGEVDGYGSAWTLLLMPGIMLFVNITISFSIHVMSPAGWNMPFKIKPGREIAVWRCIVLMNVVLMLLISAFAMVSTVVLMLERGDLIMILSVGLVVLIIPAIVVPMLDPMPARQSISARPT